MRRIVMVVGLAPLMGALPAAGQKIGVDRWVRSEMERQHIPGVAIAVMRDGKVVQAQGYGYANLEDRIRVTPETVFKIGSVSKQFIATSIMLLAQDGRLRISDEVAEYVPGTPAAWKGITLRHLLSHTSGIVREGPAFDMLKVQPDSVVIASVFPEALAFQPGEKWQYCNICYFTLADIVRRVSASPWPEFLERRVFRPAGMIATRTTTATELVPNQAQGYQWREGKWEHAELLIALRPSGAFLSTVLDLARWDAELYGDRILTRASREEMWAPTHLNGGSPYGYGLGWQLDSLDGRWRVQHGGSLAGFRSSFMRFPGQRVSVVVLTNLGAADPDLIAAGIVRRYLDGAKQPVAPGR